MRYACWSLLACCAAACGGGARAGALAPVQAPASPLAIHSADSLGHALARQTRDSAADQAVLDTLQSGVPHDSSGARDALPNVRGEEVVGEAERLFGPEGRQVVGAAPRGPTFDIDVTSFATNRRVLQYLEFFQVDARDRFEIWLSRLGRYQGMIRERLRAKGLPEDLLYLTLIESGLSNTAVSRARAVGMWQFIAGTARLYGLTVDPWVDERRDPYRATDAAVTYLHDLWQRSDLTFFQLSDRRYLRRETRDYVPKLIAAALIAKQPERYGFTDIQLLPPLLFDEILIPDATGLDVIARLADTTAAAIVELNPQFVRGVTPPGRSVTVRIPRGTGTAAAERYATLPVTQRITFVDHYVTAGQTLSDIAKRYHVTVTMIQSANPHLAPRALRVGQRVIIPMSEPRYRRTARRSYGAASPPNSIDASHRVQPGETATQIAHRYGVSLAELLDYNDLDRRSVIRVGQIIKIPAK